MLSSDEIERRPGKQGAKRQSTFASNPRDVLNRLMDKYPNKTERELRPKVKAHILDNPDYVSAIFEYWYANNYNSLRDERRERNVSPVERQQKTEQKAAMAAEKVVRMEKTKQQFKARAVEFVLLDLMMPNGKVLGDCTGADCAKAGGWLTAIAERIRPDDIVSRMLSEDQVKDIFRSDTRP
jgi:hypothetical protein